MSVAPTRPVPMKLPPPAIVVPSATGPVAPVTIVVDAVAGMEEHVDPASPQFTAADAAKAFEDRLRKLEEENEDLKRKQLEMDMAKAKFWIPTNCWVVDGRCCRPECGQKFPAMIRCKDPKYTNDDVKAIMARRPREEKKNKKDVMQVVEVEAQPVMEDKVGDRRQRD